jgi:ubiquinone/menaquinone biosynthesis C-methylase UbiE
MKYSQDLARKIIDAYPGSEREVEVPFVLECLPEPPAKVLDVGCCDSELVRELSELGYNAFGLDVRDKGYEDFPNFVIGDGRDLPFNDESFDVVTCISALEHFGFPDNGYHSDAVFDPDAQKIAFTEMVRVLKKDGQLILTLPFGIPSKGNGWERWIKFYNKREIVSLLSGLGVIPTKLRCSAKIKGKWIDVSETVAEEIISGQEVLSNIQLELRKF